MANKLVVYLADLANTRFGISPATIPLAIGYLKTYADAKLPPGAAEVRLFRCLEDLDDAISRQKPDLVGCTWYGWNRNLTVNAIKAIKGKCPDTLSVVGGPNVPDQNENILHDLKMFPWFDFLIPNEGETPFLNLLEEMIKHGKKGIFHSTIKGVYYLSRTDSKSVVGLPCPIENDINVFHSPYLNGCLDEFLENKLLMPIIQTVRGCPYSCSFCVAAKEAWKKIRTFNLDRIRDEFDYLQKKARQRTLRFTDENFGFLPRDVEIAEYIIKKNKETGYPDGIRVYTDKKFNERTQKICLLLRKFIPMNLSVQTLTDDVLRNVRRRNLPLEKLKTAIQWAHENNLNLTTEVIFGLPGETYKSFMHVLDTLVSLRVDSIATGFLMMHKEIDVSSPESIEKYGYKIMYSLGELGQTQMDDFENFECEFWAVSSNNYTLEEYYKMRLFGMVYSLFVFEGYFKEMAYVWDNRGISTSAVINELLSNPSDYPFFKKQLSRLEKCLRDNFFETQEEVWQFGRDHFSKKAMGKNYIGFYEPFILVRILKGEMIHSSYLGSMVDEIIHAATYTYKKQAASHLQEFLQEMQFAKILVGQIVMPFWQKPMETVVVQSEYDLIKWRNRNYLGELSRYRMKEAKEFNYAVRSVSQYESFYEEFGGRSFHVQSEFFFRTFRSNNIRRFIVD